MYFRIKRVIFNFLTTQSSMTKTTTEVIEVQGTEIALLSNKKGGYVSLTDMAKYLDKERSDYIIQNRLRTRNTIEFIGLRETFNNPEFNSIEFDGFKNMAGSNSFSLTPKRWIETTNAKGIVAKQWRYGWGTFAHQDIAFEFATRLSPTFKFFFIREFQRLKELEQQKLSLERNLTRTLSKLNYHIHTDAIKEHLIPPTITLKQASHIYASEADLLNVALFGKTAKEWTLEHPKAEWNIRDTATIEQLVVLSNMESINALLIQQGLAQSERLLQLNGVAITQMKSLLQNNLSGKLKSKVQPHP